MIYLPPQKKKLKFQDKKKRENPGKTLRKSRENPGKTLGKTPGKPRENPGITPGKLWKNPGKPRWTKIPKRLCCTWDISSSGCGAQILPLFERVLQSCKCSYILYLADLGKIRGCSTNSFVIKRLIN